MTVLVSGNKLVNKGKVATADHLLNQMAGKRVEIEWQAEDTPEALRERYRKQERGEVRTRLHALWLLRTGWGLEQVAGAVGVH